MSDDKPAFYSRKFLNKEGFESHAHIIFQVDKVDLRKTKYSDGLHGAGSLSIADCSRHITLDLGWWSQEDADNSLHKLDTLIDDLLKFRKAWVEQADKAKVMRDRKKKRKNGR